jgi:hypothetical protein
MSGQRDLYRTNQYRSRPLYILRSGFNVPEPVSCIFNYISDAARHSLGFPFCEQLAKWGPSLIADFDIVHVKGRDTACSRGTDCDVIAVLVAPVTCCNIE